MLGVKSTFMLLGELWDVLLTADDVADVVEERGSWSSVCHDHELSCGMALTMVEVSGGKNEKV